MHLLAYVFFRDASPCAGHVLRQASVVLSTVIAGGPDSCNMQAVLHLSLLTGCVRTGAVAHVLVASLV